MTTTCLLAHTVQLLRERPRSVTLAMISQATGLKQSWLNMMITGYFEDPGVKKVQALYEYLSQKTLLITDSK